jgi:hypothetical protein
MYASNLVAGVFFEDGAEHRGTLSWALRMGSSLQEGVDDDKGGAKQQEGDALLRSHGDGNVVYCCWLVYMCQCSIFIREENEKRRRDRVRHPSLSSQHLFFFLRMSTKEEARDVL